MEASEKVVFFSKGMPEEIVLGLMPEKLLRDGRPVYAGWGRKPSGERARAAAAADGAIFCAVEDGFYRSLAIGSKVPPMSLVFDDEGVYYDASCPSRLERMLEEGGWETPELMRSADEAMDVVRMHGLSKFSGGAPAVYDPWAGTQGRRILVAGQTPGDASIAGGLADESSFVRMLEEAAAAHPIENVKVKTHPGAAGRRDVLAETAMRLGIEILPPEMPASAALELADEVWCVSSQLGFDALVRKKKAVCFGMPFYAGWGLTEDRISCPRRTRKRTLQELFAASCLLYARWWDPVAKRRCSALDALQMLAEQKRMNEANRRSFVCGGFRLWKRPYVKAYLHCDGGEEPVFAHSASGAVKLASQTGAAVAAWSASFPASAADECRRLGIDVIRMEDGFLRSSGLGSRMALPCSLVMDRIGIHYDPRSPSELERILNGFQSRPDAERLRRRAKKLISRIRSLGVVKYGAGFGGMPELPEGRKIVLVPGQVEDDASMLAGAGAAKTNLDLLRAARREEPDAFLIWRPHPDVVHSGRKGAVDPAEALELADCIADRASMASLLERADCVHVMTSQTGFEAVLRGVPVVCHGRPFYAGWGLTDDREFIPRRHARLLPEELAAGVLILYPSYWDWATEQFMTPEQACFRIAQAHEGKAPKAPMRTAGAFLRNWFRMKLAFRRIFG